MRSVCWLLPALLPALVACGSDSTGDAGSGSIDAPGLIDGGTTVDAGEADAPSSLGDLCATMAPDGSPAACTGGTICCVSGAGTFCTFPEDCAGGTGFVSCSHTPDCPGGRICCSVPGMQFCTKPDTCDAYGGTEVP